MTALPAAASFTGSSITEAQFKSAITDMRAFLAGLLGTDGTVATALDALDTIFSAGVTAKSGAYTVAATDRGQLLDCTGTWTLTLPAAATAGAGFAFALRNSGVGVITIDGAGSETVDGELTIALAAGASAVIVCTGAAWLSVGLAAPVEYPISIANGGTGATTGAGACDAIGAVKRDHGHNNIGSLCFACAYTTVEYAPGTLLSGSALYASGVIQWGGNSPTPGLALLRWSASSLSGTWRCLGLSPLPSYERRAATLWQRIA